MRLLHTLAWWNLWADVVMAPVALAARYHRAQTSPLADCWPFKRRQLVEEDARERR